MGAWAWGDLALPSAQGPVLVALALIESGMKWYEDAIQFIRQ